MPKNKNLFPRIFAGLILVLTLGTLGLSFRSPMARAFRDMQPVFGLIVGTDWVDNARHADTIILARYEPAVRSLDLLSIPRDTRVDYAKIRVRRINEVYAYAFKASKRDHVAAMRELSGAVSALLNSTAAAVETGVSTNVFSGKIPEIQFYLQLDYEAFKKIVDVLGGVPVTVDEPMHYDDNWGKLHIHFDPGDYILGGQKALEYIRFRGMSGDYGRIHRQQEFLMTVLGILKQPKNLVKIPEMVWVSIPTIKTNLTGLEKLLILWEMKDLKRERIRLMHLPGKSQNGLWIPDMSGVSATADLLSHGEKPEAPAAANSSEKITVGVWNASSQKGLAKLVVDDLRAAGFDVVKWGNYAGRQARTLVRDHRGDNVQSRAIAENLAAPGVEVFTRLEPDPLVDVEVILGEDYRRQSKK